MKVQFRDAKLEKLETETGADKRYPAGVPTAFRRRMQQIRAAPDERDFYALKSLHYEKLKGTRKHQRSMKVNDQWRLILEYDKAGGETIAIVVAIEDYH